MSEASAEDARAAVERIYRAESRRVLASLIRLLGDFDRAEEALHDAFTAALQQWPASGVSRSLRCISRPLSADGPARSWRSARFATRHRSRLAGGVPRRQSGTG